jgi:hypothetical protein
LESGAAGLIIQALGKHLDKLFPDWREKVADKNQEEMVRSMGSRSLRPLRPRAGRGERKALKNPAQF